MLTNWIEDPVKPVSAFITMDVRFWWPAIILYEYVFPITELPLMVVREGIEMVVNALGPYRLKVDEAKSGSESDDNAGHALIDKLAVVIRAGKDAVVMIVLPSKLSLSLTLVNEGKFAEARATLLSKLTLVAVANTGAEKLASAESPLTRNCPVVVKAGNEREVSDSALLIVKLRDVASTGKLTVVKLRLDSICRSQTDCIEPKEIFVNTLFHTINMGNPFIRL